MQVPNPGLFQITALMTVSALIPAIPQSATAQTPTPAASSVKLQPYTTPDKSASAGVPSGWKVTNGEQTAIKMTGPQGATIFLGYTAVAHNAPFQAGQKGTGGTDLSMPYTANLAQKLAMILEQNAALAGKPAPQITLTSASLIQAPPVLGQCGRFVASLTSSQANDKIMGAICSLPLDSGGIFKNIMLLAQAPAAAAAQDAPIAAAVFASYQLPQAMLAKKLAPVTAAPVARTAAAAPKQPSTLGTSIQADNSAEQTSISAECFDLIVLRETPANKLPKECGGKAPNN